MDLYDREHMQRARNEMASMGHELTIEEMEQKCRKTLALMREGLAVHGAPMADDVSDGDIVALGRAFLRMFAEMDGEELPDVFFNESREWRIG